MVAEINAQKIPYTTGFEQKLRPRLPLIYQVYIYK